MNGVSSLGTSAQMYSTIEMLKRANQIPQEAANQLIDQTVKQMKYNISEKISGTNSNPNGSIDMRV
ncbi:MAG: hypothetical protein QMC67_03900 [Candidatus Wallbacteria bacterium]